MLQLWIRSDFGPPPPEHAAALTAMAATRAAAVRVTLRRRRGLRPVTMCAASRSRTRRDLRRDHPCALPSDQAPERYSAAVQRPAATIRAARPGFGIPPTESGRPW